MMMKYVKFDDESKREKISILNENAQSGVETVFDHAITDDERIPTDKLNEVLEIIMRL